MDNNQPSTSIVNYGDVRVAKHLINTEDHHTLALHRLLDERSNQGQPVILVHGAYSNRHFWLSPKGKGIARYFAEHNLDVWLMETRGHGDSRYESRYKTITADESIRYDFPAVSHYIKSLNPMQQTWIGHSYGGLFLSFALGTGSLPQSQVAAFCTIGTQSEKGQEYLTFKPLAKTLQLATGILGKFPSKLMGLGGEDEPAAISNQFIDWKSKAACQSKDGMDYLQALRNIRIPYLALAGGNDTIDPAEGCRNFAALTGSAQNIFWLLARSEGWSKDYGHIDMIIGEQAAAEVWPKLLEWLPSTVSTAVNNKILET